MARDRSTAKEALLKRMKSGMKKGGGDFENTSIFKTNLENVKFWNVSEGKHWFDIIPYKAGKHDPDMKEGEDAYCFQPYMHRNIGPNNRDVLCLARTYNKPCPICEHVKKLINDGADEDLVNEIKVQVNPRAIYNVHVLDNEKEQNKGVQVFHASHYTMEGKLLELANKPTRPGGKGIETFVAYPLPDKDGRTIYFKRKGKGMNTEFLALSFEDRDYSISKDILKKAHTLDELIEIPTYDQVKAMLLGDDSSEKDEDDDIPGSMETGNEESENAKESVEASPLQKELEDMTRRQLKKYIKENELKVSVKPKMDEDDIVEAILEAVEEGEETNKDEKKETKSSNSECPAGGRFGKDLDELDGCDNCPDETWKACSRRAEELENADGDDVPF
jgi:hypothetical protein